MTQTITLSLRSEVVYVTGTVNSVPVTWTRKTITDWSTEAAKSSNNAYEVNITAINSAGTSTELSVTLHLGLELITDRTSEDVAEVRALAKKGFNNLTDAEKQKWLAGMKGAYNYVDLNRVENAVKCLEDMLNNAGYDLNLPIRTDWTVDSLPTESELGEYLENVRTLRNKLDVKNVLPALPANMSRLTHEGANAIEEVLVLLEGYLYEMIRSQIYSNEIFSGEV